VSYKRCYRSIRRALYLLGRLYVQQHQNQKALPYLLREVSDGGRTRKDGANGNHRNSILRLAHYAGLPLFAAMMSARSASLH
jgi:hypothetical protein